MCRCTETMQDCLEELFKTVRSTRQSSECWSLLRYPLCRVRIIADQGLNLVELSAWHKLQRQTYHHSPSYHHTPVVPISTTPASDGQIFTDFGGREDAGTRVRQQPS